MGCGSSKPRGGFEIATTSFHPTNHIDFTKTQTITSDHYYCVSGKVNSADKLYPVIESVKRDTKHSPDPQLRLEWTAREKRT
ncbi:MAG: hypothetical protein ABSF15_27315 [Candidatus Sulfotelmatobacter sp.]|jgi:hypothetical protein